jgi:hypothetical protein
MSTPYFSAKMTALPPRSTYALSRVYPRLTVGGAESDILVLLEGIGDTQMIVTEIEGPAAQIARKSAAGYMHLESPRFFNLWMAMQATPLVHLHTINDHPLAPLAAQFSGATTIVQTVHNDFDAESSHFVDHSIVVANETRWRLAAPNRCTQVSSGIAVPIEAPQRSAIGTAGRPLRLIEIRRPDKPMAFTLEELLATHQLDDIEWTATVVGMDAPQGGSNDPRIKHTGAITDVEPYLQQADLLIHGSAVETFGRVVFEALAHGALVMTTALPPFEKAVQEGAALHLLEHTDPLGAAVELRGVLGVLNDANTCAALRARNYDYVKANHSTHLMIARTQAVYAMSAQTVCPPRNFTKDDVTSGDAALFCATLDALMERKTPPSIHQGVLSSRQQAVLNWLAVRFGVVRQSLAVPLLEQAASVLGPRHLLCVDLASAHAKVGNLPKALAWSVRAVELDPQKVGSFVACVLIHAATGQRSQAAAWLERIESNWPQHPVISDLRKKLG